MKKTILFLTQALLIASLILAVGCEKPDDNPVKPPELPGEVDAVKGRHTATKFIDSSLVVVDDFTIRVKARFERIWEKGKDTVEVEMNLENSELHNEPFESHIILRHTPIESIYLIEEAEAQEYNIREKNLTIYQHKTTFSGGVKYNVNGNWDSSLSKAELKYERAVYKDAYITFELPYIKHTEIISHGGNFGNEEFWKSEYILGLGTINFYRMPYTHRFTCKFGSRIIDKTLEQTIVLTELAP